MENVVTAKVEVESEAYKAFAELRNKPYGEGYAVAEASLLKRGGDAITVDDAFDAAGATSEGTVSAGARAPMSRLIGHPAAILTVFSV